MLCRELLKSGGEDGGVRGRGVDVRGQEASPDGNDAAAQVGQSGRKRGCVARPIILNLFGTESVAMRRKT
jgi:hypothetical protein